MNHKVLWKIEELWNKYNTNDFFSGLISEFTLREKLAPFYKNNISIHNLDFHLVKEFNFNQSKNFIHLDDYGKYLGLEKSQVLEKEGKLIYLFDNHHKIIQPFLEYSEITCQGFNVVHIDAHNDDAVFTKQKPQTLELKKVQEYIKETRISDFFNFLSEVVIPTKKRIQSRDSCYSRLDPESHQIKKQEILNQVQNDNSPCKLIKNIYRYTKSSDFESFKKPKNPYILSLDIDIFGPEGDFVDLESKVRIIADTWKHTNVICIAMSPGFIEQKFAQKIIEIFLK